MMDSMGNPVSDNAGQPSNNKRNIIIAVVVGVVLLCCCCVVVAVGAYACGDMLFGTATSCSF